MRLWPRQHVNVHEHVLSSAKGNFCAQFAPKWSGPHVVVKALGYTTYLIKVSRRRKVAVHCDDLRLAMLEPSTEALE
ncbi:hypothetical protein PR048_006818 [Dryococelus australis]|uniref:Reverse transcriptase RNase H-like domain-containing protein n=1 Tax=Dryococelus australis TaxID=614101 RepID=A0ABQ9IC27_9NEOP|nr:hypothetical protein PR048_006818 [Dryococelus australis]